MAKLHRRALRLLLLPPAALWMWVCGFSVQYVPAAPLATINIADVTRAPTLLRTAPPPRDRRSLDPGYIALGLDQVASLDSLGGPRFLPPLICGPFAVAGIWGAGTNSVFSGRVRDSDVGSTGALAISKVNLPNGEQTWQALVGTNTYTGPTSVADGSALTVAPGPAGWSPTWTVGRGALLCLDSVLGTAGSTAWTAPANLSITYADGTGAVYLDGALAVTAGARVTVSAVPPLYPTTLLRTLAGITGTFAATLPSGYRLVHTSHSVLLDIIR